ncbi:MAG: DUF3365 domain-containing protein [Deltaproteobacteria bacterium]|nr:DUF3365 domain-containing protein [Deltaproteobacteria bacterium]
MRWTMLAAQTALFGAMVGLAACGKGAEPPAAAAPVATEAAVGVREASELPADVSAAMDQLQGQLKQRLQAELAAGGPAAAVEVCSSQATVITQQLQRPGLRFGRTSAQLRNAANAAPAWAQSWVEAQGRRKVAAGPKLAQVDLPSGGKGYLRAIGAAPLCLTCHGDPANVPEPVKTKLAQAYPGDKATGFADGDLRGWFWAEVGAAR